MNAVTAVLTLKGHNVEYSIKKRTEVRFLGVLVQIIFQRRRVQSRNRQEHPF